MKHIKLYEEFINEMTHKEDSKVKTLLKKLKDKVKDSTLYAKIEDFIKMEVIDPYVDFVALGDHLRLSFPNVFKGNKELEMALESAVAECISELNEAAQKHEFNSPSLVWKEVPSGSPDFDLDQEYEIKGADGKWRPYIYRGYAKSGMGDWYYFEDVTGDDVQFWERNPTADKHTIGVLIDVAPGLDAKTNIGRTTPGEVKSWVKKETIRKK